MKFLANIILFILLINFSLSYIIILIVSWFFNPFRGVVNPD